MMRPPPDYTLFPYTTLFRSKALIPPSAAGSKRTSRSTPAADVDLDVRLDRKSTRLNSSHSQISYAVFCLKKKYQVLFSDTNDVSHHSAGFITVKVAATKSYS